MANNKESSTFVFCGIHLNVSLFVCSNQLKRKPIRNRIFVRLATNLFEMNHFRRGRHILTSDAIWYGSWKYENVYLVNKFQILIQLYTVHCTYGKRARNSITLNRSHEWRCQWSVVSSKRVTKIRSYANEEMRS